MKKTFKRILDMRQLGRNMAWFLKLKEAGQQAGIPLPEQEEKRIATNFIR